MWDILLKKYGEKKKTRECTGDVDTVGLGSVETHLVEWRVNDVSSVWYTETKITMGGICRGTATLR
jgi:hypothetical protein